MMPTRDDVTIDIDLSLPLAYCLGTANIVLGNNRRYWKMAARRRLDRTIPLRW